MSEIFSVDSTLPNSYIEIRDFLCNKLNDLIKSNKDIVFLCIGSDRSTGDSLGPLVGYKLNFISRNNIHIYGSLENPIHSQNLSQFIDKIYSNFKDPYVIAIDACLGKLNTIGKVFIQEKPIKPGLAMNKNLPSVGDLSITGIVNISGNFEFLVLQNTKLHTVMSLADCISKGIYHFILKSLDNNPKYFNNTLDTINCL
ncbi:spore protease YyaC [Clostridium carnis]